MVFLTSRGTIFINDLIQFSCFIGTIIGLKMQGEFNLKTLKFDSIITVVM